MSKLHSVDCLGTLGERRSLLEGRKYRIATVHEELVLRAEAGGAPAHIVFYEYEDDYQSIDRM